MVGFDAASRVRSRVALAMLGVDGRNVVDDALTIKSASVLGEECCWYKQDRIGADRLIGTLKVGHWE